jgi:hypothetical protein
MEAISEAPPGLTWPQYSKWYGTSHPKSTRSEVSAGWVEYKKKHGIVPKTVAKGEKKGAAKAKGKKGREGSKTGRKVGGAKASSSKGAVPKAKGAAKAKEVKASSAKEKGAGAKEKEVKEVVSEEASEIPASPPEAKGKGGKKAPTAVPVPQKHGKAEEEGEKGEKPSEPAAEGGKKAPTAVPAPQKHGKAEEGSKKLSPKRAKPAEKHHPPGSKDVSASPLGKSAKATTS